MVHVKKFMTGELAWIESTQTVSAASHVMRLRRIGSVLVLQGSEIIGIITERDIVRKVVACHLQPECVHVKEIMSTPVVSIDETESIFEDADTMKVSETRHLAVGNEEQVLGMSSVCDFLSPVSREEL